MSKTTIKTFFIYCFSALFGSSLAFAQDQITMEAPTEIDAVPQVIGGTPADPEDWPATFAFSSGINACTSTLVGPQVLLTAAHCVNDGAVGTVVVDGRSVGFTCSHHPSYAADFQYDVALCLTASPIAASIQRPYETLSRDAGFPSIGNDVTLIGFGCRQPGGGGPSGSFYTGVAEFVRINGIYLTTIGGAAVCFGDSGGAAYADLSSGSRRIVGVNSRGDITTRSLLTPVAHHGVLSFLIGWSDANNVEICGVSTGGTGCRP
ncbi:MAG: trypsin-like serine protease [Cohaesibacteraceae bacterium]